MTFQEKPTNTIAIGTAGNQARTTAGFHYVESRKVEGSAIGFGLATSKGTADYSCKLGGDALHGICVATAGLNTGGTEDRVEENYQAPIVRQGVYFVNVKKAVLNTDAVFYDSATGEFGLATGDTNAVAASNCEYLTSASAGGVVELLITIK